MLLQRRFNDVVTTTLILVSKISEECPETLVKKMLITNESTTLKIQENL